VEGAVEGGVLQMQLCNNVTYIKTNTHMQ